MDGSRHSFSRLSTFKGSRVRDHVVITEFPHSFSGMVVVVVVVVVVVEMPGVIDSSLGPSRGHTFTVFLS